MLGLRSTELEAEGVEEAEVELERSLTGLMLRRCSIGLELLLLRTSRTRSLSRRCSARLRLCATRVA